MTENKPKCKDAEQIRNIYVKQREALLFQVDAIEEYLGIMPKTSDIRRFAKEHGYYERKCDIIE
jgi:hypothetical protein